MNTLRLYKKTLFLFLTLLVLLFATPTLASVTEQGTGMVFTANNTFFLSAPDGWVLDNKNGAGQGLPMVFYPKEHSWKVTPVVAYGRTVAIDKKTEADSEVDSIEKLVMATVAKFRAEGSPKYSARQGFPVTLSGNVSVKVYFFEGDKWGNYEAVGYVKEQNAINYLAFSARSEKDFNANLKYFLRILATYKNTQRDVEVASNTEFDKLLKGAVKDASTKDRANYRTSVFNGFKKDGKDLMQECVSFASTDKNRHQDFDIILKIKEDATVTNTYVSPKNALSTCIAGAASALTYPPHKFGTFSLHIDMKLK